MRPLGGMAIARPIYDPVVPRFVSGLVRLPRFVGEKT